MELDPQIVPLINSMQQKLEKIQKDLLPKLDELDEDVVVSHYSLEEQARLFLSAAFATSLAMYSLDKLQNKVHHQGNSNTKRTSEVTEHDSGVDLQLSLKIERVTDYIKKLREITNLANDRRRLEGQNSIREGKDGVAGEAELSSETSRKRPREDPPQKFDDSDMGKSQNVKLLKRDVEKKQKGKNTNEILIEADLGDEAMFRMVSRIPGEAKLLVNNLLKHTSAANFS